PAIETLGRIDVLCTDKTGTLTEGKFKLERARLFGDSPEFPRLLRMACEPHITDTLEKSIEQYLKVSEPATDQLLSGWSLEYDNEFDPKRKLMSHVWKNAQGAEVLAMKG